MYKKYIQLIICLTFILVFTSCNDSKKSLMFVETQTPSIFFDNTKENDRIYIEDENAINIFKTSFQIDNIYNSACYLVDNELNVSVFLNDNLNINDIKNIELYFTKILILKQYGTYLIPYEDLYNKRIKYDSCILRIFVNDKLLVYDKYDFISNDFEYYENISINIDSRNYDDDYTLDVVNKINAELNNDLNIITVKPFKGYAVMFRIMSNEELKENDIDVIKKTIENSLTERTNINSYVGIIVELSVDSVKYKEFTYINGINKRWLDENWDTIDFIKEAMTLRQ